MSFKHLLFIPAYNCEKQIVRVIEKLSKSNLLNIFEKVLIIDNCSNDNTVKAAKNKIEDLSLSHVKLVQNNKNYNLGGTHKTAFNYAIDNGYDYVSILHGDDQGDINDLNQVFINGIYENYDCLLGSRFKKNSKLINYPRFRIYANYAINLVASIVTFRWLNDLGSGINMFKVEYLKNQFYLNFPDDLTFNYSLIFYITSSKANFLYFPITWSEDDQVSNVKLFSHAYRWIVILVKFMTNKDLLFNNKELRKKKYFFKKKF
tara:strand:+ start:411 stop:1193 length:783 start_codon:yes stop_codon:yes gene_type:complete